MFFRSSWLLNPNTCLFFFRILDPVSGSFRNCWLGIKHFYIPISFRNKVHRIFLVHFGNAVIVRILWQYILWMIVAKMKKWAFQCQMSLNPNNLKMRNIKMWSSVEKEKEFLIHPLYNWELIPELVFHFLELTISSRFRINFYWTHSKYICSWWILRVTEKFRLLFPRFLCDNIHLSLNEGFKENSNLI